jgi:arylsulfatase A-like enzyme
MLNLELPENEATDSRNTLAAFLGDDPAGLDFMLEEAPSFRRALRRGDWKYLSSTKTPERKWGKDAELYNLKDDPGESKNVIANHPEKAAELEKEINIYLDGERVRN